MIRGANEDAEGITEVKSHPDVSADQLCLQMKKTADCKPLLDDSKGEVLARDCFSTKSRKVEKSSQF